MTAGQGTGTAPATDTPPVAPVEHAAGAQHHRRQATTAESPHGLYGAAAGPLAAVPAGCRR